MTAAQKWIAAIGLLAIALTASFAPYRYEGENLLARISSQRNPGRPFDDGLRSGVTYAPLWAPPETRSDSALLPNWMYAKDVYRVHRLELEAGRLGIWWAAIGLVAGAAMIFAAPRRVPGRHS